SSEPFDPGTTFEELTGNLTTQTLTADKKYLLKGQVFVRNGQTLTVQPGTVIYGEKRTRGTLVIDRGGKLIAEGTATQPIVFTSNQAPGDRDRGDWGGIVWLGNAQCNQVDPAVEGIDPAVFFGGNAANVSSSSTVNNNDNNGSLKYVRIEFAGIELSPNNETNSLTMGGVGRGSTMEYVQVSYGGDDGFEWFGGTINGKYLVSFNMWDDDFDVDFGYAGNVQFGLAVRYPSYADQSGSNFFECDNGPNDNDVQPYTTATFSNFTGIGPIKNGTTTGNGNFQHSLDLRRRTAVSIMNSVFAGMPRGVRFNQASVINQYVTTGRGVLANNVLIAPAATFQAGTGVAVADVQAYWDAANAKKEGATSDAEYTAFGINPDLFYGTRLDINYSANPSFALTSAAATLATGASFTHPKFNEEGRAGFFTTVQHRGAFGTTDWTDGWAEFRPVDKTY
ncbi:MAG TPA: hypothetical protein VK907_03020, partial [Phnomibacter sp.]|nr:hypothetical protein [Phnomibacter sp.]